MNKKAITILIFFAILCINCSVKLDAQHNSNYAGQEKREIKSLSASDQDELRNGRGWGLAKTAELNGYPGPIHLLEMKEKINLSASQIKNIEKLYKQMKKESIPLGLKLIELERKLDKSFAEKTVDEKVLKNLLEEISEVRKELRYLHLSVHLQTPKVLNSQQVKNYNKLRGYFQKDPCQNIPKGHNPEMWKKHNNCK